ncbi:hypothetical protein AVEN_35691-1 [Araneus ventricosus]|uniref:Uncharacterized protein n=1 Tax=Araneus ventricosus TaxID=182803 RepID=A0A4Y2LF18_ARAVE|nr:hypothetical protein AVEN_35691-1 [Araneus ventricosus]
MKLKRQFKIKRVDVRSISALYLRQSRSRWLSGEGDRLGSELSGVQIQGSSAYSAFSIVCNEFDATSLLQVRRVVSSSFALIYGSLVVNLRSCRAKLAEKLQACTARLLQTKITIWVLRCFTLQGTLFPHHSSNSQIRKLTSTLPPAQVGTCSHLSRSEGGDCGSYLEGCTASEQCDLFTHKSESVIFEPPCRNVRVETSSLP